MEDQLHPIARDTNLAYQISKEVNDRVEAMENRLRRNIMRIMGLPERVEGRDPTTFVENWFLEIFGKNFFSPFFAVEHTQGATSPTPTGGSAQMRIGEITSLS